MQEFQRANPSDQGRLDGAGIAHFASKVVSLLAERYQTPHETPHDHLVDALVEASLSGGFQQFDALLAEMRRCRVSLVALADVYIPSAARRMGQDWEEDELSFMDVSIGVARLQSLLREIGVAWVADQASDAGQGSVLLIIPEREQHTLGAMVAMAQMRRFGVSVCMRFAPTPSELRALITARMFDGVLISFALRETMEPVSRLIRTVREVSPRPMPIVVGGAIMTSTQEVAACTGADLSTNDIGAALEAIGLKFDAFCVLKRA